MSTKHTIFRRLKIFAIAVFMGSTIFSCSKSLLDEVPKSSLSAEKYTGIKKPGSMLTLMALSGHQEKNMRKMTIPILLRISLALMLGKMLVLNIILIEIGFHILTPINPEVKANWVWAYSKNDSFGK